MKAAVKGLELKYMDLNTACLLVTVDKRCLNDLPDTTKPMEVEIKAKKRRRSLSANAYCWVLCTKIAEKIRFISPEDVYRKAVKDVGRWIPVSVPTERAFEFEKNWGANGLGWFAIPIGPNGLKTEYRCFIGSSVYDSEQMARLIDWLIQEAENLGIETLTPQEKARILEEWK